METPICKLRVVLLCYDMYSFITRRDTVYSRGEAWRDVRLCFFPLSLLGFCFVGWVYSLIRRFCRAYQYLVWVCVQQCRETSEVYSSAYK